MFRVDSAEAVASLRTLDANLQRIARQSLNDAAEFAVAQARATGKFKDRTGDLRKSILVRGARSSRDGFAVFAEAGSKHAGFVEYGTPAHAIEAKRGTMLRFVIAGQVRFARRVSHPGTQPTNFMRVARDKAELELVRFVEVGVNRAIAG